MGENSNNKAFVCLNKALASQKPEYQQTLKELIGVKAADELWILGQPVTSLGTKDCIVSLSKVTYDKQLYRPGEVFITFSAARKTSPAASSGTVNGDASKSFGQTLKEKFLDKKFIVEVVGFKGAMIHPLKDKNKVVRIAQEYYVQSISVCPDPDGDMKSGAVTSYLYTLKCYSPDKKLTMDRYCRVYTGQCISTGICKDTLDNVFVLPKEQYDCSSGRLLFLGYNPAKNSRVKEEAKDSTGKVNGKVPYPNELRHPYLVQYNESFYDFLGRVLHRCGEFMYFDGGKFCIGLPKATVSILDKLNKEDKKITAPAITTFSNTYPLCEYQDIFGSEGSGLTVTPFSRPYVHFRDASSKEKLAASPAGVTDARYSPGNAGEFPYDKDQYSDEDLYVLRSWKNGSYYLPQNSGDESRDDFRPWIIYTLLDMFFKSDNFLKGLITAALKGALQNSLTALQIYPSLVHKRFLERYAYKTCEEEEQKDKDGNTQTVLKEKSTKNLPDFTMDVELGNNLCNTLYRQVEQWEELSGRKMVKMSFANYLPDLSLALAVGLNDGVENNYVVTRISGKYSDDEDPENKAEAVPIISFLSADGKTLNTPGFMGDVKGVVLPPPGVPHILKSSAMEAEVVSNDDPLRIGRVRVTYPWEPVVEFSKDSSGKSVARSVTPPKSPWIRVSVPYTGNADMDSGFLMIPDVGEHVMLDYIGGNIERPFVNGSVYYVGNRPTIGDKNPESKLYWPSRKIRTIASGKGHNLTFIDGNNTDFLSSCLPLFKPFLNIGAGWLNAAKETGGPKSALGDNKFLGINGGQIIIGDGSATCAVAISPASRKISIDSRFGSVTVDAFTGISLSSPNGDINISAKNINIKAGNNISIQSGANIDRNQDILASTLGVAFGLLGSAAATTTKRFLGVDVEKIFDFTFLRCVMDSILRPVEGTLSLMSNRNTIITAGGGKVDVPNDYLAQTHKWAWKGELAGNTSFNKFMEKEKEKAEEGMEKYLKQLKTDFGTLSSKVDRYCTVFVSGLSALNESMKGLYSLFCEDATLFDKQKGSDITSQFKLQETILAKDFNIDKFLTKINVLSEAEAKEANNEEERQNQLLKDNKQRFFKRYCGFVMDSAEAYKTITAKQLITVIKALPDTDAMHFAAFVEAPDNVLKDKQIEDQPLNERLIQLNNEEWQKKRKTTLKRAIILQGIYRAWCDRPGGYGISVKKVVKKGEKYELEDYLAGPGFVKPDFTIFYTDSCPKGVLDDNLWTLFVSGIEFEPEKKKKSNGQGFLDYVLKPFISCLGDLSDIKYVGNFYGAAGPRKLLPSGGSGMGSVFISNSGGYTSKLNKDSSGWEKIDNNSTLDAMKKWMSGI